MTGIPVISELKNEASKTDFNMNPKEKLNEWQPFHMVYELRISKNVLVLLITFRIRWSCMFKGENVNIGRETDQAVCWLFRFV